MLKVKGGTYSKGKAHLLEQKRAHVKSKGNIIRGENRALLAPDEGHTPEIKKPLELKRGT